MQSLETKLKPMPLIAILRGITPQEAEKVSDLLVEAGFTAMEVTLNSPDPYRSLEIICKKHGNTIALGAGTVLKPEEVESVKNAGGELIISPNMNEAVIKQTKALGMVSMPGCYTPTESFSALDAGADVIKLFPAETLGIPFIKAIQAVLPPNSRICPTGGINPDNLQDFIKIGVFALGIGSALYKPYQSQQELKQSAKVFVQKMTQ